MPYPSRGSWQFRNVETATDFWPVLDSIDITQGNPGDIATFSCRVVDQSGTASFTPEDRVWVKFEGVYIFAGHIKSVVERMASEVGPREFLIDAQDYTSKLDDSVIDNRQARAKESVANRVSWILSFLNFSITTTNVNPPAGDCEKFEYEGYTVREALEQVADEFRCFFYIDFDKDLHFFRVETEASPFDLDDTAPDMTATFPYTEFVLEKDTTELTNAVYVQGEDGFTWVTDAPSIAAYGRQERSISDDNLKNSTQRTRAGERALAQDSEPVIRGSLVCYEPGLRGGMTIQITNDLWNLTADTYLIQSVRVSAVDAHDASGNAYLRSEIEFSERRRRRKSGRRATNKNSRRRNRGLIGTTLETSGTLTKTTPSQASADLFGSGFSFGIAAVYNVGSAVTQNTSYITSGCPIGLGLWGTGGTTWEYWLPVSATNTNTTVAIKVDIPAFGTPTGVALTSPIAVGWANATPSALEQYQQYGEVMAADGGTVHIPSSAVIQGGTNYLVFAPSWAAATNYSACQQYLSDPSDPLGPVSTGDGNSGKCFAPAAASIVLTRLVPAGGGTTSWHSSGGIGSVDGVNATFTITDWNGLGLPAARWDSVILSAAYDYEVDSSTLEVTFRRPPPVGTVVAFRYRRDP